jgi:hypothetical protein
MGTQRTSEMMATRGKNGNTNREHQKWWQPEVRMGTQPENIRNDGNQRWEWEHKQRTSENMATRDENGNTNRTSEMMATRGKNRNTNREHQKWWQLELRMGTQTENIRNDGN